jgi:hypothetical protein
MLPYYVSLRSEFRVMMAIKKGQSRETVHNTKKIKTKTHHMMCLAPLYANNLKSTPLIVRKFRRYQSVIKSRKPRNGTQYNDQKKKKNEGTK